VNQRAGAKGITPLMAACEKSHERVIYSLIKRGADVNLGLPNGTTPLMVVAKSCPLQAVAHLLAHGAEVNRKTKAGETALTFACRKGRQDTAALIIAQGCHMDYSALEVIACKSGSVDLLSLILESKEKHLQQLHAEGSDSVSKKTEGTFPESDEPTTEDGRDEEEDKEGWDTSEKSQEKHHQGKKKKKKDEDAKSSSSQDSSLLHIAAEAGSVELISFLLQRGGVDVNGMDKAGRTPLFVAIEKGPHHDVIGLLLDNKAKTNVSGGEKGLSPLGLAVTMGDLQTVSLLREKGRANVTMVDKEGYTPLTLAIKGGHQEIVSYLSERKWKQQRKGKGDTSAQPTTTATTATTNASPRVLLRVEDLQRSQTQFLVAETHRSSSRPPKEEKKNKRRRKRKKKAKRNEKNKEV